MSTGSRLIKEVQQQQLPKHDAIICKPTDASKIESAVSKGMAVPSGSNFKIRGLEIVALQGWVYKPTLCKKAEVFPVARQWKNTS